MKLSYSNYKQILLVYHARVNPGPQDSPGDAAGVPAPE